MTLRATTMRLKFPRLLLLGILLLFSQQPASALTGNEYRALPAPQRLAWTLGAADGIVAGQFMTTNEKSPFAACLSKLEREQLRAMFERALELNPERWHLPAAFTFYITVQKLCPTE